MPSLSAASARFDWSALATLRLRARAVVDGLYAGAHASTRKGSGVEFGGHRAYVPGDDLRLLDRRAMARHDRPFIRELHTETDRSVRLLVDATASMGFRGSGPVAKLEYAATLAAALTRVALSSSDPVGLELFGGSGDGAGSGSAGGARGVRSLPPASGREAFDRVVAALEAVHADGDASEGDAKLSGTPLDRAIAPIARGARRGSLIVLFSDLIDLPDDALRDVAALGTHRRTVVVVRVLDPDEATFPFDGPVRLRSLEGAFELETDPAAVRASYLEALAAIEAAWSRKLMGVGGKLVACTTADDPVVVLRAVLQASPPEGPSR